MGIITAAFVAIVAAVAAVAGDFNDIMDFTERFLSYTKGGKPTISISPVTLSNANQTYVDNTNTLIFPLEDDEKKEEYSFGAYDTSEYLIRKVKVTNSNSDHEITLDKFSVVVNNIEVDYTPFLDVFIGGFENTVYLYLRNTGWSDVENFDVILKCDNENLNLSNYKVHVDCIESSYEYNTSIELDLSDFQYLTQYGDKDYTVDAIVSNSNISLTTESECVLRVEDDSVYIPFLGTGKGPGCNAYGICIDTYDDASFEFSCYIQESIKTGECLEIPVFLFPNRSCSFDYYIEFEVGIDGKTEIIRSKTEKVEYIVNSYYDRIIDKPDEAEDIIKNGSFYPEDVGLISYPFNEGWIYNDERYMFVRADSQSNEYSGIPK